MQKGSDEIFIPALPPRGKGACGGSLGICLGSGGAGIGKPEAGSGKPEAGSGGFGLF